ncbi:MAG: 4-alpha-glucanotransferase [Chloroflexota bacterium]
MEYPRASGILLHPTSLPGRYGIGDLGDWAYQFVDFLVESEQGIWQILPLGPTSYGDSPYQALSTFAGNPNLISLDRLVDEGWLENGDLAGAPDFPEDRVDYGPVIEYHNRMLSLAFRRFRERKTDAQAAAFDTFCKENAVWLDDFALFVALKNAHGGKAWVEWPSGEALHEAEALSEAMQKYGDAIEEEKFKQWVFFSQWFALKKYANDNGVRLIGDLPIFVAHDSSDVWANRDQFYLDETGQPTVVAGVPPDYFSETGQRWGNPLYRWDVMAGQNYNWWVRRVAETLKTVDIVRIDHFRGFEAYWEIPASEPTAVIGRWVPAPGFNFFTVLQETLGGDLPIIAEDLGVITKSVRALRDHFGLPGMKVLQFAWGGRGGENSFLPHNHVPNCVVYTGTHDNNTTLGWWNNPAEVDEHIQQHVGNYVNYYVVEPHWTLIRLAMQSVAHTCVIPMQDVLGLGEEARMNTPGRPTGNWTWRLTAAQLQNAPVERLAALTKLYGREREKQVVEEQETTVETTKTDE